MASNLIKLRNDTVHRESKFNLQLILSPSKIILILSLITGLLLILHLCSFWLTATRSAESTYVKWMDLYFNFNHENNFPSYFSTFLLLFSAFLLYFIAKVLPPSDWDKNRWHLLSYIFLFLSLDEAVEIHERIGAYTQRLIKNDFYGILQWMWIVPYTILVVVFGLYFLKFLFRLPSNIRKLFILSGGIYVFAAAGIEAIEGFLNKRADPGIVVPITTTLQELLEMVGIILFIYALLHFISQKFKKVEVISSSAETMT